MVRTGGRGGCELPGRRAGGHASAFAAPCPGIQYDGANYLEPTAGASLTFGRRYGARFILHVEESGPRFQMGGYVSF